MAANPASVATESFTAEDIVSTEIGFTGSKKGMTSLAAHQLSHLMKRMAPERVHHGMCVGSDVIFHSLIRHLVPSAVVIGHPASDVSPSYRGECTCDFTRPGLPALERNRVIVSEVKHLIAAPATTEIQRSGTWATIRYARTAKVLITVILPDGSMIWEHPVL